eukprot:6688245-Pyramimonas_sp.AAC.1
MWRGAHPTRAAEYSPGPASGELNYTIHDHPWNMWCGAHRRAKQIPKLARCSVRIAARATSRARGRRERTPCPLAILS